MYRAVALLVAIFFLGIVGGFAATAVLLKLPDASFPDVAFGSLEWEATTALKARGVLSGFPDGTFKGYLPVNRAQAAKMLLIARGIEIGEAGNASRFRDITAGEWYVPYVMAAAEKGIISGYPDGKFRPESRINTAEFLKMLTLTFEAEQNIAFSWSDVSSLDWFAPYAGIAGSYGLFPARKIFLYPSAQLTRRDAAIALYRMIVKRGIDAASSSSLPLLSSSVSSFSSLFSSSSSALQSSAAEQSLQPRVIRITASNWKYELQTIRVKKGEKVELELLSSEGVHGFYLPSLGIDEVLMNGSPPLRVPLKTDSAGTFPFLCNVPCGEGHAGMHGEIIIEK